jgi:non-heme chloroperoxidase
MRKATSALLGTGVVAGAVGGGLALGAHHELAKLAENPDPNVIEDFARPAGDERTVRSPDGTEIATVSLGAGRPIVLAHGWTANLRTWALMAPVLAEAGHRVVLFDQRGHGLSTVGSGGYAIDGLADDYQAVLEQLDLHDAVVGGHSMGGIGLLSLMALRPEVVRERVAGVVFVASEARPTPLPRATVALRKVAATSWFDRRRRGPRAGLLWTLPAFGKEPAYSQVEASRRMFVDCPMTTALGFADPLADFDLTDRLPAMTTPALVLCGTDDRVTPPERSRELHRLLPDARIEWLPDAGHLLPFERASETSKLILDFAGSL